MDKLTLKKYKVAAHEILLQNIISEQNIDLFRFWELVDDTTSSVFTYLYV